MPELLYTAQGFPKNAGEKLAGLNALSFTWGQLVWAAVTVGRSSINQVARFGIYSAFEVMYRYAIVYANLRETALNRLTRSDAYDALDPSCPFGKPA